jgi:1-acyl-sn-glycerol-3-phosphate acyltransferase
MLHFSDEPYRFFPAAPNRFVVDCSRLVNRWHILPRQLQIRRLQIRGPDTLRAAWRRNRRILFVPNHPSHSDPQTMFEAYRQLGVRSLFMAAYDVFHSSRRRAWLLRHVGVFSVDRESSDKQSLNQAIQTLVEGKYALTIFPEGNVYLQNDIVTPFHEGAFYVAWRALQTLRKEGWNEDVLICPVSLKFTHLTDSRPQLHEMLRQVAEAAGTRFDDQQPHIDELRRIGAQSLRKILRQRGVELSVDSSLPLPELIRSAAGSLLCSLEAKIGLQSGEQDSLFDRIRAVRREVHRIRIDPERAFCGPGPFLFSA